jgi:hypothetical protein
MTEEERPKMAKSPDHRTPELRLRWPRYVGGALDGQPCPVYPPDLNIVLGPATAAISYDADPIGDTEVILHHYQRRRVPFAVGGRSLEVIVYAAPGMDEQAAAWRLLVELIRAAGLEAAP